MRRAADPDCRAGLVENHQGFPMNFAIHRERLARFAGFTSSLRWLVLALFVAAALPQRAAHAQAWLLSQSDRMSY
jgi:hypothetical protein